MAYPATTDGTVTVSHEPYDPRVKTNRVAATETLPATLSVNGNITVTLPGQRPCGAPTP
jgi:hypothetical protein